MRRRPARVRRHASVPVLALAVLSAAALAVAPSGVLAASVATAGRAVGPAARAQALPLVAARPGSPAPGVDPSLSAAPAGELREFLVVMSRRTDLAAVAAGPDRARRGRRVVVALQATAAASQGPVLDLLRRTGAEHRPFWLVNLIWVRGDLALVERLAALPGVDRVSANPRVRLEPAPFPPPTPDRPGGKAALPAAVEPNLVQVGAPLVWAEGVQGEGAVVGGIDTGYDWDHPALIRQYRGYHGGAIDHDHAWHDAIHSGGGICGPDSPEPCDDGVHGTHTMGIMVGDDGNGNQIGMAPRAHWIGCRCMDEGVGTPATYIECLQWMIAPTDLQGLDPRPDLAPDVINNSWICPPSEGCTDPLILQDAVDAVRASGILVVASAGNTGPECGSVSNPPAIYDAALSVAAVTADDVVAPFSARGPVTIDGSDRLKPDVSAPGVSIRSSVPGGLYASYSGTSMAGPHVAGLAALLRSLAGGLRGAPDLLEGVILAGAAPETTSQDCGGVGGDAVPNNTYGYGRIEALASYLLTVEALTGVDPGDLPGAAVPGPILASLAASPNPFNPTTAVRCELSSRRAVSLRILDARGRHVRTLLRDAVRGPGPVEALWDGRDDAGQPVVSGVYLAVATAGAEHLARKLALVR